MSIGGRSSYKGITFENAEMRVRTGEYPGGNDARALSKRRSLCAQKLGRIPFLRGLALFPLPGLLAAMALLIVNDALTITGADMGGDWFELWLPAALITALAVMLIVPRARGFQLGAVRRYHAAEHMAINTYEARLPLTAENVAAAKRTHPRCGTNLAMIFLLLGVPVILFSPYSLLLLPAYCLSYEIFLLLPKARVLKPLFTACLWTQQHVTTAAPGDKELEVAVRGMKRLSEGEGK